jgi:hypothetical protein
MRRWDLKLISMQMVGRVRGVEGVDGLGREEGK